MVRKIVLSMGKICVRSSIMKRKAVIIFMVMAISLGGCGNANATEEVVQTQMETELSTELNGTQTSSETQKTSTQETTSSDATTKEMESTTQTTQSKEKEAANVSSTANSSSTTATSTTTKTTKNTSTTKETKPSDQKESSKTPSSQEPSSIPSSQSSEEKSDTTSNTTHTNNTPNKEPSKEPEQHVCSFDSGTITTAATCSSVGVKTYRCSCGATKTESIATTGHQMTTETTAATCTEAGRTKTYCKVCGTVESETTSGAAAGHSYGEVTWFLPQTCESEGYWNQVCTVCGYAIGGNGDSTLPHSWDGGTFVGDSCYGGVTTYTCTVCGAQNKEDVAGQGCVDNDGDGICDNCHLVL